MEIALLIFSSLTDPWSANCQEAGVDRGLLDLTNLLRPRENINLNKNNW
jgi:hypothetical protein